MSQDRCSSEKQELKGIGTFQGTGSPKQINHFKVNELKWDGMGKNGKYRKGDW